MTRIGFIGVGRMGHPMVARLAGAGHDVCALGRSVETRTAIAQLGATALDEVVHVGDRAELVVVCVFNDEQVRQVCLDTDLLAIMAPGSALVIHTTGSPHTAETIATRAAAYGVDVVDAPVSGGPHDAAAGRLTLFVGGTDAAAARIRPAVASYGDPILHVGPVGAGQRVKLVNNLMFAAQIGVIGESVRLGASLGLDESTLLDALPHGSGSSRALIGIAARGSVESFVGTVGDFIDKDVAVIRKVAAELGCDLGTLDDLVSAGLRPAHISHQGG